MKTMPVRKIDFENFTDKEVFELANNLRGGIPTATPIFDGVQESEINSC